MAPRGLTCRKKIQQHAMPALLLKRLSRNRFWHKKFRFFLSLNPICLSFSLDFGLLDSLYQKKRSEPLDSKLILRDLKKINKENIDAIIISGDFTSNIKDERGKTRHEIGFKEASLFIKGLIDGLKIPLQNVIIVPGNHDMDWEEAPYYIGEAHKSDVNYRNFYTTLFLKEPNEYLSMTLFDKNPNVGIIGLNSCLLCRGKEKSWAGYVGDSQFNFTLNELTRKGCTLESVRIAVLHHHLVPVAYVEDVPAENKHLSLTLVSCQHSSVG